MNLFLKKYFFLSLLIALSISTEKAVSQELIPKSGRAVIELQKNAPVLYHASFNVLKYSFTGLIVFKHISEEKGIRIIFLSETGLSIAEFSMNNNNITCLKTLPALDKKAAKKYLSKLIQQVLTPANCKKTKLKEEFDYILHICKGKNGKHSYIYKAEKLQEIRYKSSLCKQTIGYCDAKGKAERITLQKRKKTRIELKIVENAFK